MRIAITGGPCDGKSTVLFFLKELGFPGISADEIVSSLYEDPDFQRKLKEEFGEEAVRGGKVNKTWLREMAFSDANFRRRLNACMHPLVLNRMFSWGENAEGTCFFEIPLLIETVTHPYFDEVWVLDSGEENRMKRLTARFQGDEHMARKVMEAQLPTEVKRVFADRIVRTDFPIHTVKLLIEKIVSDIDF
ncbi:MAG TPA: dephospho-CoA kinase [Fimbriimonadales bacterium]|nr:dephospho-CoA kinase [Fimbriimonadales bacterium]